MNSLFSQWGTELQVLLFSPKYWDRSEGYHAGISLSIIFPGLYMWEIMRGFFFFKAEWYSVYFIHYSFSSSLQNGAFMLFCFLAIATHVARDMDVQVCLKGLIFNSSVPSNAQLEVGSQTNSFYGYIVGLLFQSLLLCALSEWVWRNTDICAKWCWWWYQATLDNKNECNQSKGSSLHGRIFCCLLGKNV